MSLVLNEEESFSLSGYVESPGYSRFILRGYLKAEKDGQTYITPLIPQMFYGADGTQLSTWRQYLPSTGEQVILRRDAGGFPEIPKAELPWSRVPSKQETVQAAQEIVGQELVRTLQAIPDLRVILLAAGLFVLFVWGKT